MRVLVRTDASVEIGSGHLIRCMTLAEQLRNDGSEVAFVCRDLPGGMFDLLHARGYPCAKLPWAGTGAAAQDDDAKGTIEAAAQLFPEGFDWLVVDHYELDAVWERTLRPHARKLMAIDDIANRPHDCDLLLDQNYESTERYKGLASESCRLLLGPKFALLRPEYADYRKSMMPRIEELRRVLVFFGGTDQYNMTGLSLEALSQREFRHLDVDVVVGANYMFREKLDRQVAERPKTIIYGPRPHLADLMAQADLAIGAGGVTNWERMCLGLPSLVITLAENQVPISKILGNEGVLKLVGSADSSTVKDIRNALLDELQTHRYLRSTEMAMKKCDGLGVERVVDALLTIR